MKNLRTYFLLTLSCFWIFTACEDDPGGTEPTEREVVSNIRVIPNPSGNAPLTASVILDTRELVEAEVIIKGKNGAASDLTHRFSQRDRSFLLPILGLYADYDNEVLINLYDDSNNLIDSETINIETLPLIADLPLVQIDQAPSGNIKPGFNLVNYFGFNTEALPQRPFMFDEFGEIRWYLDYTGHPELGTLFSDNGFTKLQNGNLLFGNGSKGAVYEVDMLGVIIQTYNLGGYGFHHHVIEKPNGNILVTVNDFSLSTVEDIIIELDRTSGEIINTWDLNNSLDNSRRAWPTNRANLNIDWFHANGLEYSASDDAIIVSGRTQGTVKLDKDNNVIWILAPHKDWNNSGGGTPLSEFLLQPLDAQGNPITDTAVLDGSKNHPDFEWAWYQHSPILLPNGNLMVFDNGENRNYTGQEQYSRAVEYKIDEANGTIQQVFSYGKERGTATYSEIVSKVSYFENENNVLFTPGAVSPNAGQYGKVVEVDRATGNTLFEATVFPPNVFFGITFHNALRVNLYD